MTTYAFRIRCRLAGGNIETKGPELILAPPAPARPFKLYLPNSGNRNNNDWLTFWGGGFESEAEARASGAPVKVALTIAGVILGAGIDVGSDQVLSTAAKRTDGLPDDRWQPDIHGLQVVPELGGMIFGFARFDRPEVRITLESLQKAVVDYYSLKVELTKKQILAAQLYNQSHFNSTDTARFLTLISVIEVLSERRMRSTDTQKTD